MDPLQGQASGEGRATFPENSNGIIGLEGYDQGSKDLPVLFSISDTEISRKTSLDHPHGISVFWSYLYPYPHQGIQHGANIP